jgi:flavodoxin
MKKNAWIAVFGIFLLLCTACRLESADAVSSATRPAFEETEEYMATRIPAIQPENEKNRAIIFVYSHGNTRKIAEAMARKLNAPLLDIETIKMDAVDFSALEEYELVGFGSGIDSDKHFQPLLDFAGKLPAMQNKKAFIFSTCGIYDRDKMMEDHKMIKTILRTKGFTVIGDFSCPGHNTNSFLKWFGGMNKNRPNSNDLKNAEQFAQTLVE